jgi:hypothetical protein
MFVNIQDRQHKAHLGWAAGLREETAEGRWQRFRLPAATDALARPESQRNLVEHEVKSSKPSQASKALSCLSVPHGGRPSKKPEIGLRREPPSLVGMVGTLLVHLVPPRVQVDGVSPKKPRGVAGGGLARPGPETALSVGGPGASTHGSPPEPLAKPALAPALRP